MYRLHIACKRIMPCVSEQSRIRGEVSVAFFCKYNPLTNQLGDLQYPLNFFKNAI